MANSSYFKHKQAYFFGHPVYVPLPGLVGGIMVRACFARPTIDKAGIDYWSGHYQVTTLGK